MSDLDPKEILDRLAQAGVRDAAERSSSEAEPVPDLVRELGGEGRAAAPDLSFAGYVATHDRVPAFEGSDGLPYTVDVDAEETGDPDRPWAAFLVFVRWAATGAGIMGHVTSDDVAWGPTEEEARAGALELTLYELKTELDRAIARRTELLEE